MNGFDLLVDGFPHGTPEGFKLGCRGAHCVHDGVSKMRCRDAQQRYQGDYSYRKAVDAGNPPLEPESFARPIAAPKPAPTKVERPAESKPPRAPKAPVRNERRASTPKPPKAPKPAKPPRAPKQPGRRSQPINHGTVYGYMRGCDTDEKCPNTAAGEKSCSIVRREYYRDYRAKMRARAIPAHVHGSAYGNKLGCGPRSKCPGNAEGVTCVEAANAQDRRRRREQGIPEQSLRTESGPVIEHIERLRRNGMSVLAIAEAAKVGKTAVRTLVYGRAEYINGERGPRYGEVPAHIDQEKADRILAVMPPRRDEAERSVAA